MRDTHPIRSWFTSSEAKLTRPEQPAVVLSRQRRTQSYDLGAASNPDKRLHHRDFLPERPTHINSAPGQASLGFNFHKESFCQDSSFAHKSRIRQKSGNSSVLFDLSAQGHTPSSKAYKRLETLRRAAMTMIVEVFLGFREHLQQLCHRREARLVPLHPRGAD